MFAQLKFLYFQFMVLNLVRRQPWERTRQSTKGRREGREDTQHQARVWSGWDGMDGGMVDWKDYSSFSRLQKQASKALCAPQHAV